MTNPRQLYTRAMRAFEAGDFATAAAWFQRLVNAPQGRRNAELVYMLGMTQVHSGDFANGRRNLQRAIELDSSRPHYHAQLAITYQQEGDLEQADRCADQALRIQADHPNALATKADVLWLKGEYRAVHDLIEPHVADAGAAYPGLVVRLARVAGRIDGPEAGIAMLAAVLERDLAPFHRQAALFRLGELLDRAGRYDEAFAVYSEANAVGGRTFDRRSHDAAVGRLIGSWSGAALDRLPRSAHRSQKPVFIVGMMRSGTTLTEQILASHPQVAAGGELPWLGRIAADVLGSIGTDALAAARSHELTPPEVDAAGRRYLEAIAEIGPSAARVTDKTPHNFYLLGLVDLILPGARVIHCTRDPLDTCLSCFFQDLGAHQHPAAHDLAALGAYHRQYERVMRHWRDVLRIPVLEFPYERLVEDQQGQTRALLDFVGLPFDEACLRFHEARRAAVTMSSEQVRRKLYASSAGRWRNYERHLAVLKEELAR